ncbi:hypothetical protein KIW84_074384 [Lathyrus oleraceus]|uniref:Uncharacterized protein n=1 Tax=Pisum sativum TaxID=3888 RepID=A0A9D4VU27_PEA|nr:hypothetical protein KIW84_074384 [Pisum sativum]
MQTMNATTIETPSRSLCLLCLLSLLSLIIPKNLSNLSVISPTSPTFFLSPNSIAFCKIITPSFPLTFPPSISSITKFTSLTCNSPPTFPQHVTFTIHCTLSVVRRGSPAIVTANRISTSLVSQCRRTKTGFRLETFADRFPVGSIRIQLKHKFSSKCFINSSSFLTNFTGVGINSFGSRISIHSGEDRNEFFVVSVRRTLENTGLPL